MIDVQVAHDRAPFDRGVLSDIEVLHAAALIHHSSPEDWLGRRSVSADSIWSLAHAAVAYSHVIWAPRLTRRYLMKEVDYALEEVILCIEEGSMTAPVNVQGAALLVLLVLEL